MVVVTFSIFNKKLLSLVKLFHKIKIPAYAETWYLHLFKYAPFYSGVHFFVFSTGNILFGQIWSKKSKLSF